MNQPLRTPKENFALVSKRDDPEVQPATDSTDPGQSISVIGIGADGFDELGHRAQSLLRNADVVLGSWRQLNLLPDSIRAERRPWPSPMLPALEGIFTELTGLKIVVLASGDPMFHGIGTTLKRVLGSADITVIPAPSSVSLACARLGWAVDKTPVASLVTQPVETLIPLIDSGIRFLVLGRDEFSAPDIARLLRELNRDSVQLSVLSDLGSVDETISTGSAAQPPQPVSALNIIAVDPPLDVNYPKRSLVPGLEDDCFDHDGQLTKSDIRALTVSALRPAPGELLWDIGGGAGSIAIEWLRAVGLVGGSGVQSKAQAICFEADPIRATRISKNAATLGVPWLKVMGAAPQALTEARFAPGTLASAPDAIFIGGGLTSPAVPETAWTMLRPGGKIVANAVTIESEQKLIQLKNTYGGTLRRIQISAEAPVGGFGVFKPALPITQWRAIKPIIPEGV